MSADLKLYRIFVEAGKQQFPNRQALAQHVAKMKLEDFSYIRRGRKEYSNWEAISGYIALLVMMGMLDKELKPYISARVTLAGFGKSLAEKAVQFAKDRGFSVDQIENTIRDQITTKPAILPTPFGIYDALDPTCTYRTFNRIIRLRCLEEDRYGLKVRNRPIVSTRRTVQIGGSD